MSSARLLELADVLLGREEALGEERHVGHRTRSTKIVDRPCELLVHEHRDRARTVRCVEAHDILDAGSGTDVAHGRRPPLELGDRAEPGLRERGRESRHE
jgi:hypothetical protein